MRSSSTTRSKSDCYDRSRWAFYIVCLMILLIPPACTNSRVIPEVEKPLADSAFVHVHVVPMTSERVDRDQVVLVHAGRITAVGPEHSLDIPPGAEVIDGEGRYLMPGLADMHMHTNQDWDTNEWPVSPLILYLANGVTTIRDMGPEGNDPTYALQWREQIYEGARIGPTIYASGKILFSSPLADPVGMVEENAHLGFDFLKLYSYLSVEDARTALATADRLGLYSTGHIPYAVGMETMLEYGLDEIAHVEELPSELISFDRDQPRTPDAWLGVVIQAATNRFDLVHGFDEAAVEAHFGDSLEATISLLVQYQTPVCTTMVIDEVIERKLFDASAFIDRPESAFIPDSYLEKMRTGTEKHQVQFRGMEDLARFKAHIDRWVLRHLHEAGVTLVLGTDSGILAIVPGYSIHDELRILIENGFSSYEAIEAGTVHAAAVVDHMTGQGDFGTIEVGRRADLILVQENPLEDLGTIKEPLGVMARGRWYSNHEIAELLNNLEPVQQVQDADSRR